jgi:subfamily B ATP-binding cassette protein MsbA
MPQFSFPAQNGRHLAKRILHEHIKPYRGLFALACVFMIIAAAATAALPYLLQPVFDRVFTASNNRLLFIFCCAVFGSFFIKGVASYGESVVMTYVGQKIISDIQKRVFHHLMQADLAFFHNISSGELLSRFTNDINMMRSAIANTIINLGKDSFTLIFLVGVMFYRDFNLALIAFIIFPTAILPIAKIGRKMRKVTDHTQIELGTFTTQLAQLFQGIRVVKAYGMEQAESKRVQTTIDKIFKLIYKTARVRSASHPIVETLGGIAIIIVIAYGGWQVIHHNRTTGEFISFIGAMLLVYEPIKRLSNLNANLQEGLAGAARVFEVLDTPPSIVNPSSPKLITRAKGRIVFDKVGFSYTADKQALDHLSFTVEPGQTVAFVGASGAGKSTIINLIPRFYDTQEGRILLDGIDIRELTLESLRHQIALVSQEVALFDLTIANNIAYGDPQASLADIYKAADGAAASEFIEKLSDGYNTFVGENGVKLSGGQRQRIAIARAMLKDAPVLLLDEATSALDTDSERQVQSALKTLMKGRTTLMVAHRLSTVVDADQIYVLENGQIQEQGNHTALLALGGIYARLWQAQSQYTNQV